ncbi:MAG: NosD domain-containing protein [bacterium]|nr:NosD domain-containing protein [bacterium]
MRRFAKFAVVLFAAAVVVTGGCKRNDGRPFTRHFRRPAYTGSITNNTVIAPIPTQHTRPQGKVIQVPGDYKTLQEAARFAWAGDTIDLAAGTHSITDTVDIWNDVTVSGSGADNTEVIWEGTGAPGVIALRIHSYSAIENFTLRGWNTQPAVGIDSAYAQGIRISGVYIRNASDSIRLTGCSNVKITDTIVQYGAKGAWFSDCTNIQLSHSSFLGNDISVKVDNTVNLELEENIFATFWTGAIYYDQASEATLTSTRNNVWNGYLTPYYVNTDTSKGFVTPRGTDFTDNPVLINPSWGDFRLSPMSPCLTAGIGGKRIGARMQRYTLPYKTDLTVTLAATSPSGFIAKSSETEILHFDLTADQRDAVQINMYSYLLFTISFSTNIGAGFVQQGDVSLKDLNTNKILATQTIYSLNQTQVYIPSPLITIPAGQTMHLALTIDSSMILTGASFIASLKRMDWSDGNIPYIHDGRIPEIDGYNVQF